MKKTVKLSILILIIAAVLSCSLFNDVEGSGTIEVTAISTLAATITGSGSIHKR